MKLLSTKTVEEFYQISTIEKSGTRDHLPMLRDYADQCDTVVELGTLHGRSASAFLSSRCEHVYSYDYAEKPAARHLQSLAGDKWTYVIADTRCIDIPTCDMLFVDSLHTYEQVKAELTRHADQCRRWLVFHDTMTFGSIGADGETGNHSWTYKHGEFQPRESYGIRLAIDEYMAEHPLEWVIEAHYPYCNGLLIIRRVSE